LLDNFDEEQDVIQIHLIL